MNSTSEFSPMKYARVGGILYLVIIAAGIFGELFVRGKLVVSGDAVATAANIIASPLLWRMGIGVDLVMQLCDNPGDADLLCAAETGQQKSRVDESAF